jgi:glycosyltransferase involved in cell wall biosynthesis
VDVVQTCSAAVLAQTHFARPAVAVQHSCIASWWAAVRGTELPSDFAWRRELTARGLRAASAVVAPSKAFAAETRRLYDLGGPVLAVPNGRSAPSRQATSAGPADLVVTAGRLWDDGKNVSTLDRAAARLSIRFEAVGPLEGPNGARGHFANLHCGGELAEAQLAELLSTRPIFASAALYEPFGLAVLEAAQAGCALILSDIPTFRELWGEAACFVEARDGDGFAAAIQHLLDNPDERARLGEAAQARSRRYTPAAMAGSMAQLYAQLLARPSLELAGAA